MSKDLLHIKKINGKTVGFSQFWQTIASELGNSRLKINVHAESIKYFLSPESDHKDFLRALIHQSYKRCRCYHLKARFDVNVVLDILGETNFNLRGAKEDDLLDIELLEEIAWLINRHYYHFIEMPESLLENNEHRFNKEGPEEKSCYVTPVVSISRRKIRKANQKQ